MLFHLPGVMGTSGMLRPPRPLLQLHTVPGCPPMGPNLKIILCLPPSQSQGLSFPLRTVGRFSPPGAGMWIISREDESALRRLRKGLRGYPMWLSHRPGLLACVLMAPRAETLPWVRHVLNTHGRFQSSQQRLCTAKPPPSLSSIQVGVLEGSRKNWGGLG